MGGGRGFRIVGDRAARLARWLNAIESAIFVALRRLEELEAWNEVAAVVTAPLRGKTPPVLRDVFTG